MIIERLIRNELSLRRWRAFKNQKRSVIALWILSIFLLFSVTGEFWSNSKPLVMSYQNELYFPIFKKYHPSAFGVNTMLVTDYRELQSKGNLDWILWPINKWDPFESNKDVPQYPAPPSRDNVFGTDNSGRDVFARILYGLRYGIFFAFAVWVLQSIIGVILGASMGYFGGKIDLAGQRIEEVWQSIPSFFLLLILVSIFKPSMLLLIGVVVLFGWTLFSVYVRAEVLKNRRREYVEVARALGGSHARILFKHILPNSLVPVFTLSPFVIASAITSLAALDYLGFGLPPPTPSWGEMLNQARQYVSIAPWLAIYPSIALFITLTLLGLIGDGVRIAFDPRRS